MGHTYITEFAIISERKSAKNKDCLFHSEADEVKYVCFYYKEFCKTLSEKLLQRWSFEVFWKNTWGKEVMPVVAEVHKCERLSILVIEQNLR